MEYKCSFASVHANCKESLPLQSYLCAIPFPQLVSSVMIIFRLTKISRIYEVTWYSNKACVREVHQSGASPAEFGESTRC